LESGIINELTPPIIVLGMHRSGTSLLTGRLEAAGMYVGQVNTAARYNAKGNRENEDLRHFHDLMLASRGYDWKTPPDHPVEWTPEEKAKVLDILRPFVGKELWGFKDPRTIWLLEGYLELFPSCKLIATVRHPTAVEKSLNARHKGIQLSLEEGRSLWRVTNEKLLCLRQMHALTLLRFSNMGIADPLFSEPFDRFVKSCGLAMHAAEFYDRDLVHQADLSLSDDDQDRDLWRRLIAAIDPISSTTRYGANP
jgi:hypothetical protein